MEDEYWLKTEKEILDFIKTCSDADRNILKRK